jgi:hypothetical protein
MFNRGKLPRMKASVRTDEKDKVAQIAPLSTGRGNKGGVQRAS